VVDDAPLVSSTDSDRPLVTIVTPSYNQGRFIEETIESVLSQDHPEIEYLVIDGGSTDETVEVLRRYDGQLTWVSERDRGQSHAINKGWARAHGEILHWINSDDLLLPGAVSRAVAALNEHPDAVAVYGAGRVIEVDGTDAGAWPAPPPDLQYLMHVNDGILQPSCFARADVIRAVGGLGEELHWINDWDLLIRLFRAGPVVALDDELAVWRRYPMTKTQSGGLRRWMEIMRFLRGWGVPLRAPAYRVHTAFAAVLMAQAARNGSGWRRVVGSQLLPTTRAVEQWIRGKHQFEGWWPDGWAERHARLRLRGPGRFVVLRGTVNTKLFPGLGGQRLEVRRGKKPLAAVSLDDGEFELRVPVADDDVAEAIVDLKASRSFRPRRMGLNDDNRRLAYELESATLE
jgi:GT2 family glycosyltransferase